MNDLAKHAMEKADIRYADYNTQFESKFEEPLGGGLRRTGDGLRRTGDGLCRGGESLVDIMRQYPRRGYLPGVIYPPGVPPKARKIIPTKPSPKLAIQPREIKRGMGGKLSARAQRAKSRLTGTHLLPTIVRDIAGTATKEIAKTVGSMIAKRAISGLVSAAEDYGFLLLGAGLNIGERALLKNKKHARKIIDKMRTTPKLVKEIARYYKNPKKIMSIIIREAKKNPISTKF